MIDRNASPYPQFSLRSLFALVSCAALGSAALSLAPPEDRARWIAVAIAAAVDLAAVRCWLNAGWRRQSARTLRARRRTVAAICGTLALGYLFLLGWVRAWVEGTLAEHAMFALAWTAVLAGAAAVGVAVTRPALRRRSAGGTRGRGDKLPSLAVIAGMASLEAAVLPGAFATFGRKDLVSERSGYWIIELPGAPWPAAALAGFVCLVLYFHVAQRRSAVRLLLWAVWAMAALAIVQSEMLLIALAGTLAVKPYEVVSEALQYGGLDLALFGGALVTIWSLGCTLIAAFDNS